MCVCMLSHFNCVWLFATLWSVARQAPLSMAFYRQEYWNGLLSPLPGNLPNSGIKTASLMSPALAGMYFTTNATWEALLLLISQSKRKFIRKAIPNPSNLNQISVKIVHSTQNFSYMALIIVCMYIVVWLFNFCSLTIALERTSPWLFYVLLYSHYLTQNMGSMYVCWMNQSQLLGLLSYQMSWNWFDWNYFELAEENKCLIWW